MSRSRLGKVHALVLCVMPVLAGCIQHRARDACAAGSAPMLRSSLYFGTRIGTNGEVSDAAFLRFLAEQVTPRFPDGLTHHPARGQWRGADGVVIAEASHVLILLHAGDARSQSAIAEISDAYRSEFRQEAVLEESAWVCVRF